MHVFLAVFLAYFVFVYLYLRRLTKKYLQLVDRTTDLENRRALPTSQEICDKYRNHDTINALVLTGGGVRGLIPLHVLSKLEELTGKKTGELFEFMAGASTGAINCSILSIPDSHDERKYKFSAKDVIIDYIPNISKTFSAPWYHHLLTMFGLFGPRYLPDGKQAVLDKYLGDYTLADLNNNLMVPVYDLAENSLRVIRSWKTEASEYSNNYFLRDLIHGASNLPMLFSPSSFGVNGKKKIFIDPGMVINNPAEIALFNLWFLFPNKKLRIVLIGNGGSDAEAYSYEHMAEFGAYGLFQYLLNSPIISTKFSTDLVVEYIHEARSYGLDVDFVYINSDGGSELATGSTSSQNMEKIGNFAAKIVSENISKIHELANNLTKVRAKL